MPEETTAAEVAVITGDAVEAPRGFVTYAANAGIKDESLDLSIVASHTPCVAAGVFTQSRFVGPECYPVAAGTSRMVQRRAIVTVSKNANVATGAQGERDAAELAALVAKALGCDASEVLVGSTGVIGKAYPMERIRRRTHGFGNAGNGRLPLRGQSHHDHGYGAQTGQHPGGPGHGDRAWPRARA